MNAGRTSLLRFSTTCFGIALAALVILSFVGVVRTAWAQSPAAEKVVYNFRLATGSAPTGMTRDASGNLYISTLNGDNEICILGCGSILKVGPQLEGVTVFYAFGPGMPMTGPGPLGPTFGGHGVLYGTTVTGGPYAGGTVYALFPSGEEETLHRFSGGAGDGFNPVSGLTRDAAGNFYGATYSGGTADYGVIYKITPGGKETVLYSFEDEADGGFPLSGPILDAAGNLYGTTTNGGDLSCPLSGERGCGTVWKLDTSGKFAVLHTFAGGMDGWFPYSGLVMDSSGNLYGATELGGKDSCGPPDGCGTVFKIDSSGNFQVLYAFNGGANDGQFPQAALLLDSAGNLYGTTYTGGDPSCKATNGNPGCGVVFKLNPSGHEIILHVFTGGTTDGALPAPFPLIPAGENNLFGITSNGGLGDSGVLFKVQTQ
jgi:uncharacterized repeat protein (TIGR03803 family)